MSGDVGLGVSCSVISGLAATGGRIVKMERKWVRERGFTLLELMIVVAIVAILASLAIPGYGRFVERARRSDGQNMLLQVAAAQERFFTNNNRYAASVIELGVSGTSEDGNYTLAIGAGPSGNTQSFLLTATPDPGGKQAGDGCGNLTYNSLGVRAASGTTTNGKCWSNN